MSFEDLVFANESGLPLLANSLDLSPGRDESQVAVLNTILRHLGVSCTDLTFSSPLVHRVTIVILTDSLSRYPFEDQRPADAHHVKPWMTPTEVPLYIFLAYLTMFVYSSAVL